MTTLTDSHVAPVVSPEGYRHVRSLTEQLAAPLSPEDQTVQSMPDVSPTKWHRAHVSWFFEEFVLAPNVDDYRWYDERFRFLFNSYYEAVGPRHPRPQRGIVTRPGAEEIGSYRAYVDEQMNEFLDQQRPQAVVDLVELGLHHEQQHQELLLMDIKHVLSCNPMQPLYRPREAQRSVLQSLEWIQHPGGMVEVGHGDAGFAYDNERPRHSQYLRPFGLASRLVTNGEWLEFMADGGYERHDHWLSEGWFTVQEEGWEAPSYWSRDGADWKVFTLSGSQVVEPNDPVCHVSYYEADAFARWAGARLPTEAEWESVAASHPVQGRFLDLEAIHPAPAGEGETQLFGDVWEWTASPYVPYPGFKPVEGAVGEYNGKFMVNQQVLRGGACVTPPGHLRPTYRNFFPASSRWAFSGLRLARDA